MGSENNSSPTMVPNVKLREQFVQNLNGSTMEDVMSHLSQVPLFVFIALFLELYVLNKMNINVYKSGSIKLFNATAVFVIEFVSIVVPLVLMFTVLTDWVHLIFLSIASVIFGIIILSVSSPNESVQYWKLGLPHFKGPFFSESVTLEKQPFITYFRSLTFLVTSISILAVDFHSYPRRFAKTETYGVSLMDIGVGLFVFSNAIVVKTSSLIVLNIQKTLKESTVFLVLGVLRYLLIQRLNYQRHVTEYGTHWNFFVTLAFVKVLSHILVKIFKGYSFICGLVLLFVHQYLLTYSLEAFVLSDLNREDWISANREGIVSLCGYLSLYLIGIGLVNIVNPLSKLSSSGRTKIRTLGLLVIMSIILFAVLYWFKVIDFHVSRRLANLPYILWVVAVGLTLLAITLVVELLSICFLPVEPRFKSNLYTILTPAVLESINFNGLVFFLVSNVLTGVVNLFVDVLNLETYLSVLVLLGYMLVNCLLVFILKLANIQGKLFKQN